MPFSTVTARTRLPGNRKAFSAQNLPHQFSGVPRPVFFQQIGSMEFDGARADVERARGLLAGVPPHDFSQDQTLFRGQMRLAKPFRQWPSGLKCFPPFGVDETSLWLARGHCGGPPSNSRTEGKRRGLTRTSVREVSPSQTTSSCCESLSQSCGGHRPYQEISAYRHKVWKSRHGN
jgi:hypothetical protein